MITNRKCNVFSALTFPLHKKLAPGPAAQGIDDCSSSLLLRKSTPNQHHRKSIKNYFYQWLIVQVIYKNKPDMSFSEAAAFQFSIIAKTVCLSFSCWLVRASHLKSHVFGSGNWWVFLTGLSIIWIPGIKNSFAIFCHGPSNICC